MFSKIIYLIYFGIFLYHCDAKKYNNYTLYRGIPRTELDLLFFKSLDDLFNVKYWIEPHDMHQVVDFAVSPLHEDALLQNALIAGIHLEILIENIQESFDKQTVKSYVRNRMDSMDWKNYYRMNDIYNWLKDLAAAHPTSVKLQSIGKSYENRDIMALRVAQNTSIDRPIVIIEGGIHAREWISPAVVTYLIKTIVSNLNSKDAILRTIANYYEWYFVPLLNPDGYEYTHDRDRLWRKNRHGNGIDLNRNFGVHFGKEGVSRNPKAENFCGKYAFSEPESQAMERLVTSKAKRLKYYISFHSYGQYIIIPYSYTTKYYGNYEEVFDLAMKAVNDIYSHYKTTYAVGNSYETVGYTVGGVSTCWVKRTYNVKYVVTFELRDRGRTGFALPPQQILPTCIETVSGLTAFLAPPSLNITRDDYERDAATSNQIKISLDTIMIILNVLFFIIFRFE